MQNIDPRTFNIDCESVERVVSKRTKAIIPVHLFGQPCNMTGLMKNCIEHGNRIDRRQCPGRWVQNVSSRMVQSNLRAQSEQ
ncbi:MAG: DegT/DnrJ/EryC1/StrS family aminotransferase [Alistipes indistinctus]